MRPRIRKITTPRQPDKAARQYLPDDRNMTRGERKAACKAHLADLREHHSERLAA